MDDSAHEVVVVFDGLRQGDSHGVIVDLRRQKFEAIAMCGRRLGAYSGYIIRREGGQPVASDEFTCELCHAHLANLVKSGWKGNQPIVED